MQEINLYIKKTEYGYFITLDIVPHCDIQFKACLGQMMQDIKETVRLVVITHLNISLSYTYFYKQYKLNYNFIKP